MEQNIAAVKNLVRTRIPTRQGEFMLYYYGNNLDDKEHIALVRGDVIGQYDVLVRVHSECFTGDVIGSRRCDCGEQLNQAMSMIGNAPGGGVLIYLRQEGRGIGLLKKLKAYNLQDQGLDTVDANLRLGHLADERDYRFAALILHDLAVHSVKLITNNPKKIQELAELGIEVDQRIPLEIQYNDDNFGYLKTKAKKMNHFLSLEKKQATPVPPAEIAFLQPLIDQIGTHNNKNTEKPLVTLSYAQSIDGSIAVYSSHSCTLSCKQSLAMTHWLRAQHDALLVGVNTILVDDPQLTVRHCKGKNPQPVILDSTLRIPPDSRILRRTDTAPVIITTDHAATAKRQRLIEQGARLYSLPADNSGRVDLKAALQLLHKLGFKTIMVEGGATIIEQFLSADQIDHCVITVVPKLIGGLKAVGHPCFPEHKAPLPIINCQYHSLGSDFIVIGQLQAD